MSSVSATRPSLDQYQKAGAKIVPGEFLVGVKPNSESRILLSHGLELVDSFIFGKDSEIWHVKDPEQTPGRLEELSQDPSLRYAQPNVLLTDSTDSRPNDLDLRQWGLENTGQSVPNQPPGKMGADISLLPALARMEGVTKNSNLVAVIDTGIDLSHPDLVHQLWRNPKETPNGRDDDGNGIIDDIHGIHAELKTGDNQDYSGHGTHVAGIIAAQTDNGVGMAGIDGAAKILAARGVGAGTSMAAALFAIEYAKDQGAEIFNHSWGVHGVPGAKDGGYPAIAEAIRSSDALHVIAVGNDGVNLEKSPRYPACLDADNIIGVGASTPSDELSLFSNYGRSHVDICAPGSQIWSTVPGGYDYKNGTSMAAPAVTGAASLAKRKFPDLSAVELKNRLLSSADKVPGLKEGSLSAGGERLNVHRALSEDTEVPRSATDFQAATQASRVNLSWKAADDSGEAVAGNQLRWSFSPLDSEEDFSKARVVNSGISAPGGTLSKASFNLLPESSDRTLHLGLRSFDEAGNQTPIQTQSLSISGRKILFDDLFSGFIAEGAWSLKGNERGEVVWTDSPQGYYDKGLNDSLSSQPIDLSGSRSPHLHVELRHEYDPQDRSDHLNLEIRRPSEREWSKLQLFHGLDGTQVHSYDLSEYAGQKIELRFRVVTDIWEERQGTEISRVLISDKK